VTRLIILACSQRKKIYPPEPIPAIHRYIGPSYRVVQPRLTQNDYVRIISGKYGWIHDGTQIVDYNQRLTEEDAARIRTDALAELTEFAASTPGASVTKIITNLAGPYRLVVTREDLQTLFPFAEITELNGRIGDRLHGLREFMMEVPA
jgi:hypothetical protein